MITKNQAIILTERAGTILAKSFFRYNKRLAACRPFYFLFGKKSATGLRAGVSFTDKFVYAMKTSRTVPMARQGEAGEAFPFSFPLPFLFPHEAFHE
ncbi:MAG: hypothetical protein LBU46_02950 [Candidatus Accumulibacter sp.]|jgi:hypothetical protein|nr:hypothetical protein [Accumulibacter sp.]